jgi:hypothetical protein
MLMDGRALLLLKFMDTLLDLVLYVVETRILMECDVQP